MILELKIYEEKYNECFLNIKWYYWKWEGKDHRYIIGKMWNIAISMLVKALCFNQAGCRSKTLLENKICVLEI